MSIHWVSVFIIIGISALREATDFILKVFTRKGEPLGFRLYLTHIYLGMETTRFPALSFPYYLERETTECPALSYTYLPGKGNHWVSGFILPVLTWKGKSMSFRLYLTSIYLDRETIGFPAFSYSYFPTKESTWYPALQFQVIRDCILLVKETTAWVPEVYVQCIFFLYLSKYNNHLVVGFILLICIWKEKPLVFQPLFYANL